MLQVENTISEMDSVIEVDEYIPLSIEIGDRPAQLLYWRSGNGKNSMLELGVNPSSGAVQSITLVSLNQYSIKEGVVFSMGAIDSSNGSVIVDTGLWDLESGDYADKFVDAFTPEFSVDKGINFVQLHFSAEEQTARQIRNNDIVFGLSANNMLLSVAVVALTSQQLAVFDSCVPIT